jgi:hypothetical protein
MQWSMPVHIYLSTESLHIKRYRYNLKFPLSGNGCKFQRTLQQVFLTHSVDYMP